MGNSQQELLVFFLSALPVGELRAGIPIGLNFGLNPWLVYVLAVLGNLAPVLPILLFMEPVSRWLMGHSRFFDQILGGLFEKTRVKHGEKIDRYGAIALIAFVAIPSPGTGAWTGSLVAWLFGIKHRHAIPAIVLGVLIAGVIVLSISTGALTIFRFLENPFISIGLIALLGLTAILIMRYRTRNNDNQ